MCLGRRGGTAAGVERVLGSWSVWGRPGQVTRDSLLTVTVAAKSRIQGLADLLSDSFLLCPHLAVLWGLLRKSTDSIPKGCAVLTCLPSRGPPCCARPIADYSSVYEFGGGTMTYRI